MTRAKMRMCFGAIKGLSSLAEGQRFGVQRSGSSLFWSQGIGGGAIVSSFPAEHDSCGR